MTAPVGQSCANCKYYFPVVANVNGECHRYAPAAGRISSDAAQTTISWPRCGSAMWCGDWVTSGGVGSLSGGQAADAVAA